MSQGYYQSSTKNQGELLDRESRNILMAKRDVVRGNNQDVQVIQQLNPAEVVSKGGSDVQIDTSQLPEQFRGVTFEILETGFPPTIKWNAHGDFMAGVYVGTKIVTVNRKQGPEDNTIFEFEADGKKFGVWGSTVIERTLNDAITAGVLKPGYLVMIVYTNDVPTNQPEDMKMFQIRLATKK